ncbi:hypothetical protein PRIC1_003571 [Phytophthora ramorum]
MQELRENKELQKTIDTFKGTFGGRYKDIKKYNAAVKRYGQQLQRGAEFSEVRQTLPEQLEQTQDTATETYKRDFSTIGQVSPVQVSSIGSHDD